MGLGSPPHAWGRPARRRLPQIRMRFTPTRVGKTSRKSRSATYPPVHPHTRGEDRPLFDVSMHANGSPPHAWGRLAAQLKPPRGPRFTPTRVGKTWLTSAICATSPVHPHTRGEDKMR